MRALLPHRAAGRAVHAREPAAQLAQLPVGEVRAGRLRLRQCGAQLLLCGLQGSANAVGSQDGRTSSRYVCCVGAISSAEQVMPSRCPVHGMLQQA
jgi:hypothetical protein